MRIYIKSLEPLENRYTSQWKISIPEEIKNHYLSLGKKAQIVKYENSLQTRNDLEDYYNIIEIVDVEGDNSEKEMNTEGRTFLDFINTNYWKSSQLIKFIKLINNNMLIKEDKILVTDAWDPTILQLKYMISLTEKLKDVKIIGIWHAGSYDKNDFLGRLNNKSWTRNLERSLYYSIDHNCFSTMFHIFIFTHLFLDEDDLKDYVMYERDQFIEEEMKQRKIILTGQPHDFMVREIEETVKENPQKENIILFPHRLAPEKQLEIFIDLKDEFKNYEFIVCQEKKLTKKEYHKLLSKSKMIFSANLQETLGISVMEGILANNIVVVPDRLSYSEMYDNYFKYPSLWTMNYSSYKMHKKKLVEFIRERLENFDSISTKNIIEKQKQILKEKYLNAKTLYKLIFT